MATFLLVFCVTFIIRDITGHTLHVIGGQFLP
jgi:hypothetical protein